MEQEKQDECSNSPSPVVKRRSSLFSKRLSGSNYKQTEAAQEVENNSLPVQNGCAETEITLKEYVAKLHQERKDWKAVKQARKKRMKMCDRALAHGPFVLKWEESQDLLTDEDKHFIAQLPDYSSISEKLEKAEQNLHFYQHHRKRLVQTVMYLVDRLETKTVADSTIGNIGEQGSSM